MKERKERTPIKNGRKNSSMILTDGTTTLEIKYGIGDFDNDRGFNYLDTDIDQYETLLNAVGHDVEHMKKIKEEVYAYMEIFGERAMSYCSNEGVYEILNMENINPNTPELEIQKMIRRNWSIERCCSWINKKSKIESVENKNNGLVREYESGEVKGNDDPLANATDDFDPDEKVFYVQDVWTCVSYIKRIFINNSGVIIEKIEDDIKIWGGMSEFLMVKNRGKILSPLLAVQIVNDAYKRAAIKPDFLGQRSLLVHDYIKLCDALYEKLHKINKAGVQIEDFYGKERAEWKALIKRAIDNNGCNLHRKKYVEERDQIFRKAVEDMERLIRAL